MVCDIFPAPSSTERPDDCDADTETLSSLHPATDQPVPVTSPEFSSIPSELHNNISEAPECQPISPIILQSTLSVKQIFQRFLSHLIKDSA